MELFGENHIYLGYIGLFSAMFGLALCGLLILPRAIKEATKRNVRGTRIALPLLIIAFITLFGNALWITFNRLIVDGVIGSATSNNARFFYGAGIGVISALLYVIYHYGGELED